MTLYVNSEQKDISLMWRETINPKDVKYELSSLSFNERHFFRVIILINAAFVHLRMRCLLRRSFY